MQTRKRSASRTGPASYKRAKFSLTPQTKTWKNSNKTEVKQNDTIIPLATPVANGNVFTFGLMDQGTDNNQRIGKAVSIISGEARIQFTTDLAADFSNWRIVIGIWKQAYGGAVPTPSDIFQLPGSLISPINAEDSTNLVILSDKTYSNPPTVAIGNPALAAPAVRYVSTKWRYRGVQEYKGPAFNDVQNLTHFIMLVTDNIGGANARAHLRVYYTDN